MTPFLYSVAKIFYSQFGNELYKHTFVFPNKRAGVFFQKYLAEIAGKPIFSPSIITIQELFASLSPYQLSDKIELLVLLYKNFGRISGSDESFDDFLYWGEMLLNDFNDVDKHLTDAKQLFRNVHDLKSLEGDMSHLTESQIVAIRRFWKNFMLSEGNETKQKFQKTWAILIDLYTSFRAELYEKGCAYEGMMFREVAERAKAKENIEFRTKGIVFVGLNALTPSEMALMDYVRNNGVGDFYWDYQSPLVQDKQNKASMWVEENLVRFPSKFSIENTPNERDKTDVQLIAIPSAVGQAKMVTKLLEELIENKNIEGGGINTAIVLPDENLLLPVLYSIPNQIEKINVTMGYGMAHVSVASLVDHIADLQRNVRMSAGETVFYHRFVSAILSHPLVRKVAPSETQELKTAILTYNKVVVSQSEIPAHPLLQHTFTPISDWRQIPEYLKEILSSVYGYLTKEKQAEENEQNRISIDLEREFIVHYYKSITRLQDTLTETTMLSVETYFRLLKRLAQSISVPFSGEPLSGLQIMGVLETRVLDFENLIILSMNEGVFPLKNPSNSFIPYTLRKGFGLPTYEHQDSTYAYHFYRMISRAKRVFMLYDTRAEEMQTGEVSRYFYQMKYLYDSYFEITANVPHYTVSAPEIHPVSVSKTPDIRQKIMAFTQGNDKYLSASLINNYINCPLLFYFTAVEGLSEEDEVQESIEADVFGSIFHRVMEMVYNRLKNNTITPDALTAIVDDEELLTEMIEKAFARYYFKDEEHPQPLEGQHYLIGEILRSYAKQTLAMDKQFTPFQYVASEYSFQTTYRVSSSLAVNFKGSIDRVDEVKGSLRVIDYKTGTGATNFKEISDLFDGKNARRPYQILQVFVYALFYLKENPDRPVAPAIYYLRSIFNDFTPAITCDKHPVNDISLYMDAFVEQFDALLSEIFDPSVPFSQTQNERNCEWCAFKQVCNR